MRGKGHSLFHSPEVEQDHPRLCGEKFDVSQNFCMSVGSPPPMRGKGKNTLITIVHLRITPAYAGKSKNAGIIHW